MIPKRISAGDDNQISPAPNPRHDCAFLIAVEIPEIRRRENQRVDAFISDRRGGKRQLGKNPTGQVDARNCAWINAASLMFPLSPMSVSSAASKRIGVCPAGLKLSGFCSNCTARLPSGLSNVLPLCASDKIATACAGSASIGKSSP